MEQSKYKEQNNKHYKKIIIILFISLIFILITISIILQIIYKTNNTTELSYDNLTTIKQVIEYYGSKYISEKESKDSKYTLEVSLQFKFLPYNEDDTSNEEYYNNLIEDCAKIISYKNFKMLDKKNDLNIEVICNENRIISIIINGIEDYFIYMDSQLSMKQYKEIPLTEFNIQSNELKEIISNNWNPNINLGERDSIFDEYYIFFNKGIKTRMIDNKIYNIVFDKKYKEKVINNIYPGMDLSDIEFILGTATFKDDNLKIIGYKGEKEYIFFTESEISVYRVNMIETNDFFELTDKYIDKEIDFLEFMNQLTYLWPDYSDYEYTSKSVFISYPLKGVEIKLNYDDMNGIFIFNNIKSNLSKVERYLENTDFVARLQLDLVFEAEKRRTNKIQNWLNLCREYEQNLDDNTKNRIGTSLNYELYPELDDNKFIYSMKFISKFGEQPNRELSDTINSYLWINNDLFLYSKKGKGIYIYNLEDGTVRRIITGTEEYELKGYKDGILRYDNIETEFQY